MKTENILTIIIILIILTLFLLAGIIAPRFFGCTEKPRWDLTRSKMAPIKSAINVYKLNTGKIPDSLEDLIICPAGLENVWKGPYLKKSQIYDSWDNLFVYEPNTDAAYGYDLISYGQDGKPGGEGYDMDIYNDR